MMKILLAGVNHKSAPIDVRELLALDSERLGSATRALLHIPNVCEALIISTCNRVEFVLCYQDNEPDLMSYIGEYFGVDTLALRNRFYQHRGADAVQHIFRVGASLDSMVVGEPQVLGQLKDAYSISQSVGGVGTRLERLMQTAFSVAKKVRNETKIGISSVSIASVAVDLAKQIFGSLKGKRVMLVGAGKMSQLAAQHLARHGAESLLIVNRTFERAVELAQDYKGLGVRFDELHDSAEQADIIITSTGSQDFLFRREHAQKLLRARRNRPIVFIDIASPRDIDPEVKKVEGLFLYDIDALQSIAASHLRSREKESQKAEFIVAQEAIRFQRQEQALSATPMIVGLQGFAEEVRQVELQRSQTRLRSLTLEQQTAVEALTRSLVNKLLHTPMRMMRAAAEAGDLQALEVMRSAFTLETSQKEKGAIVCGLKESLGRPDKYPMGHEAREKACA